MSQENINVVRQMLDAFNRGDVPAVIAAFDENCELYEPPEMPDTPAPGFRGHDGIREWMTNLREVAGVEFEFGRIRLRESGRSHDAGARRIALRPRTDTACSAMLAIR